MEKIWDLGQQFVRPGKPQIAIYFWYINHSIPILSDTHICNRSVRSIVAFIVDSCLHGSRHMPTDK